MESKFCVIGIEIEQILARVELEWNQINILWGGIGIGVELNIIGLESELNWNRLLPELHIIAMYTL